MSSNRPTFIRFDDTASYLQKLSFNFVDESDYITYKVANSANAPVIVSNNALWIGPTPWGLLVANATANVIIQIPTPTQIAANYVLLANGSWGPGGGGGGGAVAGANTQVQFNDSSVLGATAGFSFNKTSNTIQVGNSTVFSTVNSTFFSQTANNTSFVGSVSAANVVSNAQLIANLAGYQPAGAYLTSIPATYVQNTDSRTLSGNLQFSGANVTFGNSTVFSTINATFFSQTANNALFANNATNLGGVAAASYLTSISATYVQNTDSRTLSGNLVFSGANVQFTGGQVNVVAGSLTVGNSTFFTQFNPVTFTISSQSLNQPSFQANSSALVLGNSSVSWTANQIYFGGPSTFTLSVGNTTVNATMNATSFALNGTPISQSPWTIKSANYTALNGDKIIANTQGGAFTVTLPATPTAGYEVSFADSANNWVTNNLTISRNGSTIVGSATDLVCDTQAFFKLLYSGSTWVVESTPSPSPGVGSVLYSGSQTLSNTQQLTARQNVGVTTSTRSITAADTLVVTDYGKLVKFNSASNITVGATAAATLGDGWWCDVININTGIITFDPNSAETVDGATTASIYQLERMRIYCDGTGFWTTNHGGDWVQITPTLSDTASGTPTATTKTLRYKKVRTQVQFYLTVGGVGGTGTAYLSASMPIAAASTFHTGFGGGEYSVTGNAIHALISAGTTTLQMRYYNNGATSSSTGATFYVSGAYEVAK